jgi:small subunit ribosomal protein S18
MTDKNSASDSEQVAVHSKSVLDMAFDEVAQHKEFVTDTGRILPRKYTGLTSREQRALSRKVKQARQNLLAK